MTNQTTGTLDLRGSEALAAEIASIAAEITNDPGESWRNGVATQQSSESPTRVFILHQDMPSGLRAKQTLDYVRRQLKLGHQMQLSLWRFELLEDSTLRHEALFKASQAAILFLSLRGDQPLPVGVSNWLKQWTLLRGEDQPCALVVSLDEKQRDTESAQKTIAFARNVATAAGAELILQFAVDECRNNVLGRKHPVASVPVPQRAARD